MKHHVCALSGPANSTFARKITTDSRGNKRFGVTAVANWGELVFPLSLGCPFNWRELLGVGVTARVCLVLFLFLVLGNCPAHFWDMARASCRAQAQEGLTN